jgi:hypothetical protein
MYDKLASLLKSAIKRWTAESPQAWQIVTNVSLGIGITATVVTLLPFTFPAWVIPAAGFLIAFSSKMTVE